MNLLLGSPLRSDQIPAVYTLRQIINSTQRMVFFEGNDGWITDGTNFLCEINSFHPSTAGSIGVIATSFADGHAVMWNLTKWGAEQRSWISMDAIDNVDFNAWLSGDLPPGVTAPGTSQ
jgi:hypothetical protein